MLPRTCVHRKARTGQVEVLNSGVRLDRNRECCRAIRPYLVFWTPEAIVRNPVLCCAGRGVHAARCACSRSPWRPINFVVVFRTKALAIDVMPASPISLAAYSPTLIHWRGGHVTNSVSPGSYLGARAESPRNWLSVHQRERSPHRRQHDYLSHRSGGGENGTV